VKVTGDTVVGAKVVDKVVVVVVVVVVGDPPVAW
jgi:hypothetical protein